MAVTFLCSSVFVLDNVQKTAFSASLAQLTNPFCSKLDTLLFLLFIFSLLNHSFVIAHVQILFPVIFNICVIHPVKTGMLCVYKSNDKKKFTNLNLKEIRHEAEKELENLFSSLSNTQWRLFLSFWNWDLKTLVSYDVEMQCLYRTMSLSRLLQEFRPINKVDQFSTTEHVVPSVSLLKPEPDL